MSKSKIITILCFVVLLITSMLHAGPSVTGLINSDFKAGKITFDDAVIYKALAVQTPWILPKKYRDGAPVRDGTPLILEVLIELKHAHPEVQKYVKYILASPKDREKIAVPSLNSVKLSRKDISLNALVFYKEKAKEKREQYVTPEGHFIIYYYKNGKESVDLSYVEDAGKYLEESWERIVDDFSYRAPSLGDDGHLDVFIEDLGSSYGSAYPGDSDTEAYIKINRDYSDFSENDDPEGKAVGALKVTTAHELFHHIQYAYLSVEVKNREKWWIESCATFMEDEVYDYVNDYDGYIGEFMSETDTSIDELDTSTLSIYGAVLINKLLKERFNSNNQEIIREILEEIDDDNTTIQAMAKVLGERGQDLAVLFSEFALWNLFTGTRFQNGYYEEGEQYDGISGFQNTHTIGTSITSTDEQKIEIDNLAASYYQIIPDPEMTETRTLSFQVARSNTNVLGRVVVWKKSGGVEVKELTFDTDNKAKVSVENFSFANIQEVVLILSNGDQSLPSEAAYSVSLVIGLDLIFVIDTTGSMWDDIANVKASSTEIVNMIDEELNDYRIAVVDYRDFPVSPYGGSGDYPYHAVLPFSTNKNKIIGAIQGLSLGWGNDWRESVYSALIRSIQTEGLTPWRTEAQKNIIILGDAPPHDPEPFTNYTLSSVVDAAASVTTSPMPPLSTKSGGLMSVTSDNKSQVSIFSISIGYDSTTYHYFSQLSEQTGGKAFKAPNASNVVEKIIEIIGEIEEPEENHPPICSGAAASISQLWPPNHKMKSVKIVNVEDPDGDPFYIEITGIIQDEPVSGSGKSDKSPDGQGVGTDTAWLRAERFGKSDSRVYTISFIAYDDKGAQCSGSVMVCVPHDQGLNTVCIDDGQVYDSTVSSVKK
jgi:hypothetical protein